MSKLTVEIIESAYNIPYYHIKFAGITQFILSCDCISPASHIPDRVLAELCKTILEYQEK